MNKEKRKWRILTVIGEQVKYNCENVYNADELVILHLKYCQVTLAEKNNVRKENLISP